MILQAGLCGTLAQAGCAFVQAVVFQLLSEKQRSQTTLQGLRPLMHMEQQSLDRRAAKHMLR
jgi:hypothetical protein